MIQHFEAVRAIRNKTLHDAHYELDGQTADDCLDKMNTIKDKTAKPPDNIHNKSLEEIEGLIYDTLHRELKESVVDEVERKINIEVKREVKQVMQNYSITMKGKNELKIYNTSWPNTTGRKSTVANITPAAGKK
ncbi:hypothetical protein MAR_002997 [Mya arenaria]|uniref:Uncharacterized protein n=1 Tax=Mya arenaria TaxID=6604 RepID=A0ABY7G7B2_MYAAR|nr:hypothetical protein MAR_002997 [Mya arenaria]